MDKGQLLYEFTFTMMHAYEVENALLGKCIRTHSDSNYSIELCLPCQPDNGTNLVAPNGFHESPDSSINWGKFYKSSERDNNRILSIVVRIYQEGQKFEDSIEHRSEVFVKVQNYVNKIAQNIRVINPKCLWYSIHNNFVSGSFSSMTFAYCDDCNQFCHNCVPCISYDNYRVSQLTIVELKDAYHRRGQKISLQFSLYGSACDLFYTGDVRNSILTCATLIEVIWKKELDSYFAEQKLPKELCDHIKSITFGYTSYKRLFKKLRLPFYTKDLCGTNVESVMNLRNRIIHAGFMPVPDDGIKSLALVEKLLYWYKVPKFDGKFGDE